LTLLYFMDLFYFVLEKYICRRTKSMVFRLEPIDDTRFAFYPHQTIFTSGAHDAETISFNGMHFLFFSEDRSDSSTEISSHVSA
jgi:hypothetical protein